MKSFTVKLVLATAACLVASCAASAADYKFEIPFTFEAAGKVMTPGTYKLRPTAGEHQFLLFDARTGHGVFVQSQGEVDPQKEWTLSHASFLQFVCRESNCALSELYTHRGYPAHKFAGPKGAEGRPGHVALIRAVSGK